MESSENKNYEKYVEDPNYRPLTSDDISWYLEQKPNNKEFAKVEHIVVEDIINPDEENKKVYQSMYQTFLDNFQLTPQNAKIMALHNTVASEVLDKMANSLIFAKKTKNGNFCKKLLISNNEGFHTYAFIYGIHNNKPFVITFAQNDLDVLKQVMKQSRNMLLERGDEEYGAVEQCFGENILCISSVNDTKSCGTIALKIMKYLTFEDIQQIINHETDLKIDAKTDSNGNVPPMIAQYFTGEKKPAKIILRRKNKKSNITIDGDGVKYIMPNALPPKLVPYIQSITYVKYHDQYCEKHTGSSVYDTIKSKDRIKLKDNKEINTTAEVKQKQIINRITTNKTLRKQGANGISAC